MKTIFKLFIANIEIDRISKPMRQNPKPDATISKTTSNSDIIDLADKEITFVAHNQQTEERLRNSFSGLSLKEHLLSILSGTAENVAKDVRSERSDATQFHSKVFFKLYFIFFYLYWFIVTI